MANAQRTGRRAAWLAAALGALAVSAAHGAPGGQEAPVMAASVEVFQYRRLELAVESDLAPADALDRDAVVADWAGPDGATMRTPAFWDGGRTWRVRFAPPLAGRWTYRIEARPAEGPAAELASGTVDARPAAGASPLERHGGQLKVGPGGRYLVHTDGTPFFWLGDTWWFCPSDLVPIDRSNRPDVPSMYKALVDLRASQGFTAVHMAFLGSLATGHGVSGNYAAVFGGRVDPAYWQTVDRYLDYANAKGLVPVIGFGFHVGLNVPTLGELQRLWRYALARYGAHGVTFLISGEYNLASVVDAAGKRSFGDVDEKRVAKVLALGRFIKEHDPYRRAMTVHPWYFVEEKHQAWDEPWCDVRMIQGSHITEGPPPKVYLDLYARTPVKPLLEGECTYEGIHAFTDATVRRNAYKAIQCGSFGFTYGAQGLWYPTQDDKDQTFKEWGTPIPWWKSMAMPGAAQMKHLRTAYERIAWWRLAPVDPGRLTHAPGGGPRPEVFVKADGDSTILVYFAAGDRSRAAPRLRLAGPGGTYAALFLDPRTGAAAPLAGPVAAEQDVLPLPAPPDAQDWVLILQRR